MVTTNYQKACLPLNHHIQISNMKNVSPSLSLVAALSIQLLSCSTNRSAPDLVYNANTNGVEINVWEIDRRMHDPKSTSNGESMINANGDLQYIIQNIYNADDADLDISELSKKDKGYKVEVKVTDGVNIRSIINQTLADWLTDANHEVFYGKEDHEIYTLSVENEDLLLKNIYVTDGGTASMIKTTSKEIVLDGSMKQLANVLGKQALALPVELAISDTLKAQSFSLTLKRKDGIEGISEQLSSQYGLRLAKETKYRKVLNIQ